MQDNPYAATSAQPVPAPRRPIRWRAVLAATVVAFAVLPGMILAMSLKPPATIPGFLFEPAFLGTLALTSVLSALACERAALAPWLHACVAAFVNLILFAGVLMALKYLLG